MIIKNLLILYLGTFILGICLGYLAAAINHKRKNLDPKSYLKTRKQLNKDIDNFLKKRS